MGTFRPRFVPIILLALLIAAPHETAGARRPRKSKSVRRGRRSTRREIAHAQSFLSRWAPQPREWDIWFDPKGDRHYFDGAWKLKKFEGTKTNPPNDPGLKAGCFKSDFDDGDWDEALVPYDWNDKPPPPYGTYYLRGRRKHFKGVGWYRTTFTLSKPVKNRRVILHFDAAEERAAVYVNGKKVGEHKDVFPHPAKMFHSDTFNPFEIDITDAVEAKEPNTLAVRIYDSSSSSAGYEGEVDRGGIWLPCYIDLRPAVYARHILITPNVKSGEIRVMLILQNSGDSSTTFPLAGEIESFESWRYKPPVQIKKQKVELGEIRAPAGLSTHEFKIKLDEPVPWTPDKPMLYRLRLVVAGGKLRRSEIGRERFGLREVSLDESRFLLNGKPVLLRGTQTRCPHMYNSLMASNQAGLIDDWINALKELNFNFVMAEGGHWPRAYFDAFDEQGILVCVVRDDVIPMAPTLPATYQVYFGEILRSYYNHPSIIANVAAYRVNPNDGNFVRFQNALYDFYKSVDPTRPVATAYSMAASWRKTKTDFYCVHETAGSSATYLDTGTRLAYVRRDFGSRRGKARPLLLGRANNVVRYYEGNYYKLGDKTAKIGIGKLDLSLMCPMLTPPLHGSGSYLRWSGLARLNWWKHHRSTYYDFLRGQLPRLRMAWKETAGWAIPSWELPGGSGGVSGRTRRSEFFQFLRQSARPVWVGFKDLSRHILSGRSVEGTVLLVNNSLEKIEAATLEIEILEPIAKTSRRVLTQKIERVVDSWSQIEIPVRMNITNFKTGDDYVMKIVVRRKGKESGGLIVFNTYKIFILDARDRRKSIPSTAGTMLYESANAHKTSELLKKAKVKFMVLKDFKSFAGVKVLIFGKDSFDAKMAGAGGDIRKWLEGGGRIIVFEQKWNGPVPWLPEIRWAPNAGGSDPLGTPTIEIVRPQHPAFKDLSRELFWDWPGQRRGISRYRLLPLTLGTKAMSYNTSSGSSWGMALAEMSVGKGLVLATTIDATDRYGKDAAATHFTDNLLAYALGKSFDGKRAAEPFFPLIAPVPGKGGALPVKLAAKANAGLRIDPKSQTDGWVEGTLLASSDFPRGRVTLRGIPFQLPKANSGKAFIAVGGANFPTEVTDVKVYRNASMLYLLLAGTDITADMFRRQVVLGKIRFIYGQKSKGKPEELDVVAAANISNWVNPIATMPNADLAWCSYNPNTKKVVGFSLVAWENPRPRQKIAYIEIESLRTESTITLLGVTVAKSKSKRRR